MAKERFRMAPKGLLAARMRKAQVEPLLEEVWKLARMPRGETVASVNEFLLEADRTNRKHISPQLVNNVMLYDQFIVWLARLSTLLYLDLFKKGGKGPPGHHVYRHLTAAVCSLAISIRTLILEGHDVPAKILLRSLREYVDVLLLLIVKPELVSRFQVEDLKLSNSIWHQHVKSGRARKDLWRTLLADAETPAWRRELSEWQKDEETVLSVSAHPSYVAAAMVTVMPLTDGAKWLPFVGQVSNASIRTLHYAMITLSELVALTRFPFKLEGVYARLVKYRPRASLHTRVERGRHVLLAIFQILSRDRSDFPELYATLPLEDGETEPGHPSEPECDLKRGTQDVVLDQL